MSKIVGHISQVIGPVVDVRFKFDGVDAEHALPKIHDAMTIKRYVGLAATVVLSVVIGLVISSAFSAILVYATDLMPGKVGMIAGVFFGLMFGLGGLGSAFFGWLADRTSIEFIFQVSTLLPLLGVITGFLPNIESKSGK